MLNQNEKGILLTAWIDGNDIGLTSRIGSEMNFTLKNNHDNCTKKLNRFIFIFFLFEKLSCFLVILLHKKCCVNLAPGLRTGDFENGSNWSLDDRRNLESIQRSIRRRIRQRIRQRRWSMNFNFFFRNQPKCFSILEINIAEKT